MNTKQKTNWWVDLILFAGFIVTFFLDLTGVELHQWIGIFAGALAAYHLLIHREWIAAVSQRFFTNTSNRSRMYYLLDAVLLAGFTLIVGTGLVISTWLNLALGNYQGWLTVHIVASISTLVALVVKLGLHWRWIARAAQNAVSQPVTVPSRPLAAQPVKAAPSSMSRREFLQVMSVVSVASFLALITASKGLADTASTGSTDAGTNTTTQTNQTAANSTSSSSTTSSSSSNSICTLRCRKGKHCSFTGDCHSYTDTNNNNRCDLGEC
jgi:hypothetical protein